MGDAAYLSLQVRASHASWQDTSTAASVLRYFRSMPQVVLFLQVGRRLLRRGCCAWAAALGLLRLGCWRSAWCTQSLPDTSRNFAHFLVGFRSVTPCCLCCFDLGTLEQPRGPFFFFAFGRRFCEFARQPYSTFGSSILLGKQ